MRRNLAFQAVERNRALVPNTAAARPAVVTQASPVIVQTAFVMHGTRIQTDGMAHVRHLQNLYSLFEGSKVDASKVFFWAFSKTIFSTMLPSASHAVSARGQGCLRSNISCTFFA